MDANHNRYLPSATRFLPGPPSAEGQTQVMELLCTVRTLSLRLISWVLCTLGRHGTWIPGREVVLTCRDGIDFPTVFLVEGTRGVLGLALSAWLLPSFLCPFISSFSAGGVNEESQGFRMSITMLLDV